MSAHSSAAASPPEKRTAVTIPALGRMTAEGQKIAMLTAYDATLAAAGASLLVAECVPRELGAALTKAVGIPVIGIGAGPACSGQVLVIYDALGVTTGRPARFVRNFMVGHDGIEAALGAYVVAVKDGSFPAPEHCF